MHSTSRRVDHRQALLASLSTAGIAIVAASESQAGIVVTPVNEDVGWVQGGVQTADFVASLPGYYGLNSLKIRAFQSANTRYLQFQNRGSVYMRAIVSYFHPSNAQVVIADKGQKWDQIGGSVALQAMIASNSTSGYGNGHSFKDKYFAFEFNKGTSNSYQLRFGWIKASLTNRSFSNLFLHIDSYAYDDSGAQIAMGDTGVPEPSSAIQLAALAAMTLGAAGVRRWKAARAAVTLSTGEVS